MKKPETGSNGSLRSTMQPSYFTRKNNYVPIF
jgi:hypothetical protein